MNEPTENQEKDTPASNGSALEIRQELRNLKNKGKTPEEVLKTLNDEISQVDTLKGDIEEYQTNAAAIKDALVAYEAALEDLTKREQILNEYNTKKDAMIKAAIQKEPQIKAAVDRAKEGEEAKIERVAERIVELEAELNGSGNPASVADRDFDGAKAHFDSLIKRKDEIDAKFKELEQIRDSIEKAEIDKEEANRYGVMYYYMNKFIQFIEKNDPKFFHKTNDLEAKLGDAWFDLVAQKNVKQKRSHALARAQAELEEKQTELKSHQDNFDTEVLAVVRGAKNGKAGADTEAEG